MRRLGTILVAAVALVVVPPAQGTSSSSASLTDFAITLFDLNPTDGVTPAIMFPSSFENNVSVLLFEGGVTKASLADSGAGPFDLNLATAFSAGHAAVNGTSPETVTALTASGSGFGTVTRGGYNARAQGPDTSEFRITANTLVSFSALMHLEAAITTAGDTAGAGAMMSAGGPGAEGSGSQSSFDSRSSFVTIIPGSEFSITDRLSVSFVNLTDAEMVGQLGRDVFASGAGVIPEPETYAILLAGLGSVVLMIRRRRQRE
jgi:hypothetical protein